MIDFAKPQQRASESNPKEKNLNDLIVHIKNEKFDLHIDPLLIKNVKDLNAKDDSGLTPLVYAVRTGNPIIVNQLIQAKADVNISSLTATLP